MAIDFIYFKFYFRITTLQNKSLRLNPNKRFLSSNVTYSAPYLLVVIIIKHVIYEWYLRREGRIIWKLTALECYSGGHRRASLLRPGYISKIAATMAATCTWKPCEDTGEEKAIIGKVNPANHANCLTG